MTTADTLLFQLDCGGVGYAANGSVYIDEKDEEILIKQALNNTLSASKLVNGCFVPFIWSYVAVSTQTNSIFVGFNKKNYTIETGDLKKLQKQPKIPIIPLLNKNLTDQTFCEIFDTTE
jgi:hypothetical protein